MEVMFVWCIGLSLVLAIMHLLYRIYLWRSVANNYDRPLEEGRAAKMVFVAFCILPLTATGPLFLLALVVYGVYLFFKALNKSMSKLDN